MEEINQQRNRNASNMLNLHALKGNFCYCSVMGFFGLPSDSISTLDSSFVYFIASGKQSLLQM